MPPARTIALLTIALCAPAVLAQTEGPRKHDPQPTTPAITPADLMTRLYIFADDSMMGREAGTEYNLKGTAYIESEVRKLGLVPAGDSGGYFQNVPLVRRVAAQGDGIAVEGASASLRPDSDYLVLNVGVPGAGRPIGGTELVFAGSLPDTASMLASADAMGKTLIVAAKSDSSGHVPWNFIGSALRRYGAASALLLVSLDVLPDEIREFLHGEQTTLASATSDPPTRPSLVFIGQKGAETLLGKPLASVAPKTNAGRIRGSIAYDNVSVPGRNVVAILPGSDRVLRNEYVAIGAHNDHVGFTTHPLDHDSVRAFNTVVRPEGADSPPRQPTPDEWTRIRAITDGLHRVHGGPRLDSVFNGADDDGSGSMGVLEIAEAFAKSPQKPKRSILFVWHTAEELGLYGSEYYTDHPTVPRDSIVAQLNIDMLGRGDSSDVTGTSKEGTVLHGGPGYLQLVGSRRLSTELGDLAETVDKDQHLGLTFDYAMDANGHPENYYCRSDHYEYARYGIPIIFFSTGGHRDYHQLTDEPQYIDYAHFAKATQLVYDIALRVADLDHRVVVDHPKPDPHGSCMQ